MVPVKSLSNIYKYYKYVLLTSVKFPWPIFSLGTQSKFSSSLGVQTKDAHICSFGIASSQWILYLEIDYLLLFKKIFWNHWPLSDEETYKLLFFVVHEKQVVWIILFQYIEIFVSKWERNANLILHRLKYFDYAEYQG